MTEFAIESDLGTLPLIAGAGDGPYTLQMGTTGLGLPAEILEIVQSPAGGGRFKTSTVGIRQGVLSIGIHGTEEDMPQLLRTLGRHLEAVVSPFLVVTVDDGAVWRLGFYRDGGGEDVHQKSPTFITWNIAVKCPDPFWVSDVPVQIGPIGLTGEPVGLLPDLAELKVMGSSAFGDVTVENPGDAPAPVTWMITGPGGPTTVALGGQGFTFATSLGADEKVTIRKGDLGWTVTDQTGANRYGDLGPAPKFPSIPIGESTASVLMTNAGAGSSVAGFFRVLSKVVV